MIVFITVGYSQEGGYYAYRPDPRYVGREETEQVKWLKEMGAYNVWLHDDGLWRVSCLGEGTTGYYPSIHELMNRIIPAITVLMAQQGYEEFRLLCRELGREEMDEVAGRVEMAFGGSDAND